MTNENVPTRHNNLDAQALAIVLARTTQGIQTVLIDLIEHLPGGPSPTTELTKLADHLTWVSHTIRATTGEGQQ